MLLCVTTLPRPPTLASYPRRNSLDALRLVLATLVIVSHSWPVGGFGPDPRLGVLTLGEVAVAGFFGISGWLITASRMTSTLRGFAWRRCGGRALAGRLRGGRALADRLA